MVKVKICGVTEMGHIVAACQAGADFIGLVFAPSRRQIAPEKALPLVKTIQTINPRTAAVGVFVNVTAREVNRIASYCHLDWVQLSGDEDWEFCRDIERPIIKVMRVSERTTASEVLVEILNGYRIRLKQRFVCLLDSKVEGTYGGSGQSFNWEMAKEIAAKFPVMIAGGLTTENVRKVIKEVCPWGVDVSSGIETDGRKDETKIRDFVKSARRVRRIQDAT